MAILTISRQRGSLGDEIALLVAKKMDYRVYDREIINKAAVKSGSPEAALVAIDELGLLGLSLTEEENCAYQGAIYDVIQEIAEEGNAIILGRAGQIILSENQDALHVRIIAPKNNRVQREAQKQGIEMECAGAQVEASDHHRKKYMRRCFDVHIEDPEHYDLVINTRSINVSNACDLICQALSLLQNSLLTGDPV